MINPLIALSGRGNNVGNAVRGGLEDRAVFDINKERRETRPQRNKLLDLQVQGQQLNNRSAENQVQNQEALGQLQRAVIDAESISQALAVKNIPQALEMLNKRRQGIIDRNGDSTHTDRAIAALSSGNPQEIEALQAELTQIRETGQRFGIVSAPQQGGGTPTKLEKMFQLQQSYSADDPRQKQISAAIDKEARRDPNVAAQLAAIQAQLAIDEKQFNLDQKKQEEKERKEQAESAAEAAVFEASSAIESIDSLLKSGDFKQLFGTFDSITPEIRPSSVNAKAKVEQIVGLLSLESRQKLKGQGTITDGEAKTLERSATILANTGISDDLAQEELLRVRNIFLDAKKREEEKTNQAPRRRAGDFKDKSDEELLSF